MTIRLPGSIRPAVRITSPLIHPDPRGQVAAMQSASRGTSQDLGNEERLSLISRPWTIRMFKVNLQLPLLMKFTRIRHINVKTYSLALRNLPRPISRSLLHKFPIQIPNTLTKLRETRAHRNRRCLLQALDLYQQVNNVRDLDHYKALSRVDSSVYGIRLIIVCTT